MSAVRRAAANRTHPFPRERGWGKGTPVSANVIGSSPFKGEVRWGMGLVFAGPGPIPTPTLPLKGREKGAAALKLARMWMGERYSSERFPA